MTKTTAAKRSAISDRTWQGQQSWNREVIESEAGHRLRLTVKVDSYDFQSYAKAERWDGMKWHEVHRIPGQEVKARTTVSYVARSVSPNAFTADIDELRRVAIAIVGGAL